MCVQLLIQERTSIQPQVNASLKHVFWSSPEAETAEFNSDLIQAVMAEMNLALN